MSPLSLNPMNKFPKDLDLRRMLKFSNDDGSIWLAESRMLLMHAAAIAALRKELIESGGVDHARRIFTRMGYESGLRDVGVAKNIRAGQDVMDIFMVGPQLHTLEGIVRVTPEKLEMDIASGRFYAEVRWDNSWEAQAHLEAFGQQHGPVCWMQLGYASGYTSGFMGRFILYQETNVWPAELTIARLSASQLKSGPTAPSTRRSMRRTRWFPGCWRCVTRSTFYVCHAPRRTMAERA